MGTEAVSAPLIVFDLDGTLVDSLRDIAESVNECLGLLGLPGHPVDAYRYMVGEGIPKLSERAIGASHPHLVRRLSELTRARYRTRPLTHTRPYAGVEALIRRLRVADVTLAVLSNKPHDMTVQIVRALWPDGEFAQIVGYQSEGRRKPDPVELLAICRAAGVAPADAWMVGDTATDMETAKRAGVKAVGVTWGFRTRDELQQAGADRIIDHPDELA